MGRGGLRTGGRSAGGGRGLGGAPRRSQRQIESMIRAGLRKADAVADDAVGGAVRRPASRRPREKKNEPPPQ